MISDPKMILDQLELRDDMRIADLGAGTGSYVFPLAARLPRGKVYAVEIQKELLFAIKRESEKRGITNIEIIWATIDKLGGTKIADRSLDAVLISNVLFQIEDKTVFIAEIKRILKPEGQVFCIDWSDSFSSMGPQPSDVFSKEKALALFVKEGFTALKELQAGDHHYGIIFKK